MPVQIEAKVARVHEMAQEDEVWRGNLVAIKARVTRVHGHPGIMMDRQPHRIDPDKWRPLIMSFQQFYGLVPEGCSAPNPDNSGERLQATRPAAGGLTQHSPSPMCNCTAEDTSLSAAGNAFG
jgi:hypothetical protein